MLVRSIDISALKEYTYSYEDGKLMRAAEYAISVNDSEMVTARTLTASVLYSYDRDDNVTCKRVQPVGGAEQITYFESTDDNTVVKFTAGGKTVTAHSKTDSFGRKEFDELQLGSGFLSRQFRYLDGEFTDEHVANDKLKSSPTTPLVSEILFADGRTISYEYDEEDRITKATDSVDGVTAYTYDALGQLLTETRNNQLINEMAYVDANGEGNYGNIVRKNGVLYQYDSVWKDLLTQVGDQTITYDAQGNPLNYLGHTLAWEKGRQLKAFDTNTYTYNANGIRTSKTVNGTKHEYLLDGTKILRETWGDCVIIPLYDNEDSVCGIEYNGTAYFFVKNLQGDVIAITNNSGDVVARYTYDAWGVCTIVEDDTDCDIAEINPFRYRGYYYDTETNLYYLQSRYYDPQVSRFINADDATLITENASSFCNLYTYVNNNTPNEKDISGYALASILFNIFAGIICGLLIQLYSDLLDYFIVCIIKGKKRAKFTPCLGDYISSVISYVLEFTNPFKGATLKAKILATLIPLAAKYAYKLLFNRSSLDLLTILGDVIFSIWSIYMTGKVTKKTNDKLIKLRNSWKSKSQIHVETIKIRAKGKALNHKYDIRVNISQWVFERLLNLIYSFVKR